MAYANTEVAVSKSQDAIRKLVYAHRGTGLMLISHPPQEGFEAFVTIEGTSYQLRILAKCEDVSHDRNGILRNATSKANAMEQEARRVWRVLYWYLKALFDAADAGVIDIRNIIMPYVVLKDGLTLSEHIVPRMADMVNMTDFTRRLTA